MKLAVNLFAAGVLALFMSSTLHAESATYFLNMSGDQEAPGPGDPDGLATGTISLDDSSGLISWEIMYSDIATPSAMHIHGPDGGVGTGAGVHIGLNVDGSPGVLMGSQTEGDLAKVSAVLADPSDFYLNIHNSEFNPGAVRGQLGIVPEPSSALLFVMGLAVAGGYRRRKP